jgi:hypothetical protein
LKALKTLKTLAPRSSLCRFRFALPLALLVAAAAPAACGSRDRAADSEGDGADAVRRATAKANADRLAFDESGLLDDLATTDVRLARRFDRTPSASELGKRAVGSILAEDPEMMVVDGALDLFSVRARARALDAAEARVAAWTYPLAAEPALERDLVKRLLREEKARVADEKTLPRAASELVRGVLLTWTVPEAQAARDGRDAWLGRRLDDLTASLKDGTLTQVEKDELDDTLDALEHLAAGYERANGSLAKLRLAIDKVRPAPAPDASRWKMIRAHLSLHLGFEVEAKALAHALEEALATLKGEIKRRRAALKEDDAHARELAAEPLVLIEARCPASKSAPPRLRTLGPPPERAAICGALVQIEGARGEAELLPVVMALHDDVMAALWALAIHADLQSPDAASKRYRPSSFFPPEREVRLLRRVAVCPTPAIATGWAIALLIAQGMPSLRPRASRWLAFGDAPVDVVQRHLDRSP